MSLLATSDAIWVANKDDGTVSRIDPASDHVDATVQVGGQPWGLAFDGSSVWVGNYAAGRISRIDPATNRVTARVRVGQAPIALGFGRGGLWVGDYSRPHLFRIDTKTGRVTRRFVLSGSHLDVLVRRSGIWVASEDGIARVSPSSGGVLGRISGGIDTTFLTPCAGSLWATNFMGRVLWRIDERRTKLTAGTRIANGAAGIGCRDRTLWVAAYYLDRLLEVRPSGVVVSRLRTGSGPTDVVATSSSVWVANSGSQTVTRFRFQ